MWCQIWETPRLLRTTVLKRLALWCRLDAVRPELTIAHRPSYAELLARFNSALAAGDWPDGEATLAELRRLHLATAENLQFLHIQLLTHRGAWREVWENAQFDRLVHIPLPRAVRAALITGFHSAVLLPLEQQGAFEEALAAFRQARTRLGSLLNGRFGLSSSPVVRVFGYQAALSQDRPGLDLLLGSGDLDAAGRTCLMALLAMLPPPSGVPAVIDPETRFKRAMRNGSYDEALDAALAFGDAGLRALNLLRIAARHQDAARAAIQSWETLSAEEHAALEADEPALDYYLSRALAAFPAATEEIRDWNGWFTRLFTAPDDARLIDAVEVLTRDADDREWTPGAVRAVVRHLERLFDAAALLARRSARRGLAALIDHFLSDTQYPCLTEDYVDLYEILFNCLLLSGESGEATGSKLLRLADAVLRSRPAQLAQVAADLQQWFSHPSPALETLALDAFDLLMVYGLSRAAFIDWYRAWVTHRLDLPDSVGWPRAHREVWLALGEWVQPGADLLLSLQRRLSSEIERGVEDPLLRLPDGFRIGIFTLHESSAERASALLRQRHAGLDIRVCAESDMSRSVEALARNSDAAVIVTTCLSHAIFYGIQPLLQHPPVYPAARGSASIMRAVEDFARAMA